MYRIYTTFILVLGILMFGLVACGSAPISEEPNSLIDALSVLPVGANHVYFTNWALIKETEGFMDITSSSPESDWEDFFQMVFERHSVFSGYGIRDLKEHAEMWGWDTADLDWEVSMYISQGPGFVLKFRDDFNFSTTIAHFEDRDFSTVDYHGVTVYSHALDTTLEWLLTTEFSVLNTAVVPDTNMLIMSISPDLVYKMLDALNDRETSLADDPNVIATVNSLSDVVSAFISADACSAFSSEALLKTAFLSDISDQIKFQLKERPDIQDYEVLGIGYKYEMTEPIGLIVMHFSDESRAKTDLLPRSQIAVEGFVQSTTPRTYSEAFFNLVDASVEGEQIIIKVQPLNNRLRRIRSMINSLDLIFATCP